MQRLCFFLCFNTKEGEVHLSSMEHSREKTAHEVTGVLEIFCRKGDD